jgi:hypothetical protein
MSAVFTFGFEAESIMRDCIPRALYTACRINTLDALRFVFARLRAAARAAARRIGLHAAQ